MRTVSLFKNGRNQALRIPKEFEFEGVTELEIFRDGDSVVLKPIRKNWSSFASVQPSTTDFLSQRPEIIEEGRVKW